MNDPDNCYLGESWNSAEFGRFTASEAAYFSAETGIDEQPDARVLEVGFGNGAFLGWVKSVGGNAFGIEANPVLTGRARAFLGGDRVFESPDDQAMSRLKETMTYVVAFDVMGHVPMEKMVLLLRWAHDMLSAEGRLLVRFPNGDRPFGRIPQHLGATHVTALGYQRLEFFAGQSGLRVVEIRGPGFRLLEPAFAAVSTAVS